MIIRMHYKYKNYLLENCIYKVVGGDDNSRYHSQKYQSQSKKRAYFITGAGPAFGGGDGTATTLKPLYSNDCFKNATLPRYFLFN